MFSWKDRRNTRGSVGGNPKELARATKRVVDARGARQRENARVKGGARGHPISALDGVHTGG